ncbi:gamma-glutamylcyclotransferase, partial [Actinomadura adrarensis]
VADGVLISGLTEAEHRLLDAYEDDDYEPAIISVEVHATGVMRARAYVWAGATEPHDWDPEHFAEHDLPLFAEGCRTWRTSLDPADI